MQTQALYLYASSPETQSKKRKNLRLESNTSLCEMEIGRGFTNHPGACNVPAQCPQPLNSLLIILLCIMNLLIGQSNQLHLLSIKWMDWRQISHCTHSVVEYVQIACLNISVQLRAAHVQRIRRAESRVVPIRSIS